MKNSIIICLCLLLFSCNSGSKQVDHLELEPKLAGKWVAAAFDGELHEKWTLEKDGWMLQEGYYIEDKDTTYSAHTKMEKVGNEIILLSVIKNSNPKIFKATSRDETKIIFKNDEYKNPFEVTYEFLDQSNYRRTIRGYEKDSLVSYEFNFKKVE